MIPDHAEETVKEVESWCLSMCLAAEQGIGRSPEVDGDESVYVRLWKAACSEDGKNVEKEDNDIGTNKEMMTALRDRIASETMDHVSQYYPKRVAPMQSHRTASSSSQPCCLSSTS